MSSRIELQAKVVATIKADATTMSMIDGVYDNIPANPFGVRKAYISLGNHQKIRDDADCIKTGEHFFQLDVWSRGVGKVDCQRIVDRVETLFLDTDLSLTTNALVLIEVQDTNVFRDPDGLTHHGVVPIRAMIEEATN